MTVNNTSTHEKENTRNIKNQVAKRKYYAHRACHLTNNELI